jgi:polyisoprenoid-binding protein YceI
MSRQGKIIAAVVAVVVVLGAGVGLWWFLRDDAPAEVSLETATESVTSTTTGGATPTTAPTAGVDGRWSVDTESGTFDYESATGSFVGFRIDEELVGIGGIQAVGRTGDVTGELVIEGDELTVATFAADMASITTNDRRRDVKVAEALEVGSFPEAGFALSAPIPLGAEAATGAPQRATASGEFTLHGVTRSVEVPIEAQLVDGTVVVVGSFEVALADYDLAVPSAPIVISASDTATIEFQLLFTRA